MEYGEKFVYINKNDKYKKISFYIFLLDRKDKKEYVVEENFDDIFRHYTSISYDDLDKIMTLEDFKIYCENKIKFYKDKLNNVQNLPNSHYMLRILNLRDEISIMGNNLKENRYLTNYIPLIEQSIKEKNKGIKRLSKRIYNDLQNINIDEISIKDYNIYFFQEKINTYSEYLEKVNNLLNEN